jgi:hypothetical protein
VANITGPLPPAGRPGPAPRREETGCSSHFERKPEKDYREGHARALCRECPVRETCLEYSLAIGETHGIWGGLNELERRRLARRRAADAAAAASGATVRLDPRLAARIATA